MKRRTFELIPFLFLLAFIFFSFSNCRSQQNNQIELNQQKYKNILGCWKGWPVDKFSHRNEEYRLISLKPDGNPAITLSYELTPRNRVWDFDLKVHYKDGVISWKAHTGHLSENKDTMTVIKEWKGVKTNWLFVRKKEADDFMRRLASSSGEKYVYKVPDSLADDWNCSDISEAGIDKKKVVTFIKRIAQGKHGDIHSILIAKDNKLVLEEYFATNGKRFGSFIKEAFRKKPHHLASTTKGILSALTCLAIDKGFIETVEAPIYNFLQNYSQAFTDKKKQILIKHVLTMTAGWEWEQFKHPWDDPRNNAAEMWRCNNVIKYVLERPLAANPGEKFTYSNGVPTVMGAILKNACGQEVDQFAKENLFQPLGISDFLWTSYFDGSLETDGGLALRSRDLAKIGRLFLNKGSWKGQQVISEEWIEESTKSRIKFKGFWGWSYGYYWMQVDLKIKRQTIHSYFIPGDGGQLLSVFPDLNMVIVFTAGNYGTNVKAVCFSMIYNYILPATKALN